jgi:hypothetical protein
MNHARVPLHIYFAKLPALSADMISRTGADFAPRLSDDFQTS